MATLTATAPATTATAPVIRLANFVSGGDYHKRAVQTLYADEVAVGYVYRSYLNSKWVAVLYNVNKASEKKTAPADTKDAAVAKFTTLVAKNPTIVAAYTKMVS